MKQTLTQLKEKLDLQYRQLCLEKELAEAEEAVKCAKYEKRETEARVLEYGGSFKSLFHGLSGKKAEEKELLENEARNAAARLEAAIRSFSALELQLRLTKEALSQIPEILPSEDPEWQRGAAQIQAAHLLKITQPLTDSGVSALELAREWTQPKLHLDGTTRTRFGCQEAANKLAKEICRNVEALNECFAVMDRPPVELGPYFYSPEAYLVTAFQYGTLDQINKAMNQMLDCRRALKLLLAEFE